MWLIPWRSTRSSTPSATCCVTRDSAAAPKSVRVLRCPVLPNGKSGITRSRYRDWRVVLRNAEVGQYGTRGRGCHREAEAELDRHRHHGAGDRRANGKPGEVER